ncbi:MAG: AtpZ/AtpI family protein [Pseudomonadota bacterium]
MDEEKKRLFRTLGHLSTIGLTMAISIALGALIGHWLDDKFGTEPWLLLVFLGFGIAAAFKNLYVMYNKIKDL